jgi:hypothetical protein
LITEPDGVDNREAWLRALTGGLSPDVTTLVAVYLGVNDGTGTIERHFSRLCRALEVHKGPMGDNMDWLLEILTEGPTNDEELASSPGFQLSTFTRRCCQLWIAKWGRRFGCYQPRADRGTARPARAGTDRSVELNQKRTLDALAQPATQSAAARSSAQMYRVFGGGRRQTRGRIHAWRDSIN